MAEPQTELQLKKGADGQPVRTGRRRYMLEARHPRGSKTFVALKSQPMPPQQVLSAGKPSRIFTFRRILWGFPFVLPLAVIVYSLIRPYCVSPQAAAEVPKPRGEEVLALGKDCRAPAGLSEVIPAYLPPLDGLGEGAMACIQRQLDTAGRRGLPVEAVNSIGMKFRLVPSGDCMVGSPESESGHSVVEKQHLVSILEPFYMGATEVTQRQWEAVMGAEANPSYFRGPDLPVEEVSWWQCMEFLRRLNERERLPKHSYRLPSEAEWEYACRAGSQTAYCFGNDVKKLGEWADFDGNNYKKTSPVGQRRANALGLYDMHGNVWEWCRNLYRNYPGDETPLSEVHSWRCIRGGNWYVQPVACRSANRSRLPDRSAGNMLGFRVMRVIQL